MFYTLPYNDIVAAFVTYSKEVDPGAQSIFDVIINNASLIEGLATLITVIGGAVGGGVTWLRRQNIKQYDILKTELSDQIRELKDNATQEIQDNKRQIHSVQENLCSQINHSETRLKDKIDTTKESLNDIRRVVEKIDEKMDVAVVDVSRTTTRLDGHDIRIKEVENEVYGRNNRDLSFTSGSTSNIGRKKKPQ